jgi:hypothetical protein
MFKAVQRCLYALVSMASWVGLLRPLLGAEIHPENPFEGRVEFVVLAACTPNRHKPGELRISPFGFRRKTGEEGLANGAAPE